MSKSRIPEKHTYIILIFTLISIIGCIILNISLFYGFAASITFSVYLCKKNGFSIIELLNMIRDGLYECKSLFILIALIGAMISIWMSSGVVSTMLYYGLKYMKDTNFLFSAFVLTSAVSIFMGTAFGTISSVGIALLVMSKIFGTPDYVLLGAIVSGAFIADKSSPISNLFNLTLEITKIGYKEAIISMLKTLLPTFFISASVYYFIGKKYSIAAVNSNMDNFMYAISSNFVVSPLILLLPLSIIIMSFLGMKMLKSVSLALIAGIIVSIVFQKTSLNHIIAAILSGYTINTDSVQLNTVLVSGGMVSMISLLLIIAGAVSLSSIFQGTGLIIPIIKRITFKIKSREELVLKTGFISGALTAISDQSVGIILPGRLLSDKYKELEVKDCILARTMADTGTVIAPLIPWNVNSLFILVTTGISTTAYAPYAVLCYVSPIITFISAFLHKFQNIALENKHKKQ